RARPQSLHHQTRAQETRDRARALAAPVVLVARRHAVAGPRSRGGEGAGAQPALSFERSDCRRQPVQSHRSGARRVLRPPRTRHRIRPDDAVGNAGYVRGIPTGVRQLKIVHITLHLPPDQAANALLPFQLGEWARARGDLASFVSHPPLHGGAAVRAGVITIPRTKRSVLQRTLRAGSIAGAWRIRRDAGDAIRDADLVHVHSNGLLPEAGAAIAARA